MAFDYLGTFNRSQFNDFLAFARSQLPYAASRIRFLSSEISRIGTVTFNYNQGVPEGYGATPEDSYLGKLLAAYEVLGGNPFLNLKVRQRTQAVYIIQGDETTPAQFTSSGEVVGGKGLMDGPTAELMRAAKGWMNETLQARFNRLERKIRRALDYSDQLRAEIAELEVIQLAGETRGSLEFIASQINEFLDDNNYRAIYDDNGADRFGLKVYAPFSSYDATPPTDPNADVNRERVTAQREDSGFRGPGEKA
jgi:hypothetical protein